MKNFKILLALLSGLLVSSCDDEEEVVVTPQNPTSENVKTTQKYIDEFQNQNQEVFSLLSANPNVFARMNSNGTQNAIEYIGIDRTRGYFNFVFSRFSEIKFKDVRITPATNGTTVFVQANGFFIVEGVGSPYNNVYIFRIDFDSAGKITTIEEYFNPVINGEFLRQPLGSCQEIICD